MDNRDGIYQELHGGLLENIEAENRHSAETILKMLFDIFQPNSVLDVGCGLGTWLSVAQKMNVSEIMGIDGSWLDKSRLRIDPDLVSIQDLEQPLEIGRKFDLVICLEVAEHLSSDAAPNFIDSLTNHGDIILFSAAIPFQGGSHHINERFPDYWYSLFRERDFEVIDFIRPQIWDDSSVLWWLSCCAFNLYNSCGQDARTTRNNNIKIIGSSCVTA
jgi:cyclopropane fatty-acyl-phospholipid synthase-like methyltransferase